MLKVVIAGNYREFEAYCRDNRINPNDRTKAVYVSDRFKLITFRGELILYGAWYERRDIDPFDIDRFRERMQVYGPCEIERQLPSLNQVASIRPVTSIDKDMELFNKLLLRKANKL